MPPEGADLRPIGRIAPVREAVQDALKHYILDNGLRPGDPLPSESQLARQLGVGRNSIREAVKSLEALGIIEVRIGVGLWVRGFNFEPMLDGLTHTMLIDLKRRAQVGEVRHYLELGSASDVVRRTSDAQLQHLDAILAEWQPIADSGIYSPQNDRRFHDALWANLDNEFLSQILDTFWESRHRVAEAIGLQNPPNTSQHYRVHHAIVDALRNRDIERFIEALRQHQQGLLQWADTSEDANRESGSRSRKRSRVHAEPDRGRR
jgi:DNA-binding FadR family transcriptional regulator